MTAIGLDGLELNDAWIEGNETARWRSATAHGPDDGARATGSSLLEVDAGCHLPRHTDSEEEVIAVLAGDAEVTVGDRTERVVAPAIALVPKEVPHRVRNAGDTTLRFLALYAGTDVTTRYEEPVQPDGERERKSVS